MPSFSISIAVTLSVRIVITCAMLMLATSSVNAAPFEETKDSEGLVWFIGTIEQVNDGVPTIDLGEVHTLRTSGEARSIAINPGAKSSNEFDELPTGCRVVAIRNRNDRFSPLGVMQVGYSYPTWCEMEKPKSFTPEVGDIVMFVAAPGDLGSGASIRDEFIRHQIISNSSRNRYSTVRDSVEANALQRVVEKQPTWVQGNRRIAGVIRSASVTKDAHARLKPFMSQIMMFQDYQDQGNNVSQVTSDAWRDVLAELRHRNASSENVKEAGGDQAEPSITTENKTDPALLVAIRRIVDESMFERFPEERDVIAVVCSMLLQTKTANERQWMGLQLLKSQFPGLGRQEQVLIDMDGIMRRVRQTE
ncbi:MAG: hypothetical protein O2856_03030 [Planctomycetota bacterium]|nr:hypothetical protein [Planctomycetota bacterium]